MSRVFHIISSEFSVRKGIPPHARFFLGIARLLPDFSCYRLRTQLFRLAGFEIGRSVSILGSVKLVGTNDFTRRLTVGEGTLIAPGVTFGLDGAVTIGENVSLSPEVVIYTATHNLGFGSRRMSPAVIPRPVVICNGVWIGMNALVLPGVTIGQGAVVAAGSVVAQNVPPNTMVAGNPAIVQQELPFGNR